MIDKRTKMRIAEAVGIHIHGHPLNMRWATAVDEDSSELDTVVEILHELEERRVFHGSEEAISGARVARERLYALECEARSGSDMRYVAETAREYLDRILERV